MEVDVEHLQSYYSSLSDEALMEIDRYDLVEAAQKCYDEEVAHRQPERCGNQRELPALDTMHGEKPAWFDDASEIFSVVSHAGTYVEKEADQARSVLEGAGIPCYLDFSEDPPEDIYSAATHRWRVLVPGRLNTQATNILDRDIFNDEFESIWKAHLEMLTDQELSEAAPQDVFCGLFDKIERVSTAYSDELLRRGLQSKRS